MFYDLITKLSTDVNFLNLSRRKLIDRLVDLNLWDGDPFYEYKISQIPEYIIAGFKVTFYGRDGSIIYDEYVDNPQYVKYGKSAIPPTPPDIGGWKFSKYLPDYTNVKKNLQVYAIYVQMVTVTYKYYSDLSVLSSQQYEYNTKSFEYIDKDKFKRPYRTIIGYIPESPEELCPLSTNCDVYLNDVKNTITVTDINNKFKYDEQEHFYEIKDLEMYPIEKEYIIFYRENDDQEWSQQKIGKTVEGKYDIQYTISADDFEQSIVYDTLEIDKNNLFRIYYNYLNYDCTKYLTTKHDVYGGKNDTPPNVENTISLDFVDWSSKDYLSVDKDCSISAEYKIHEFDVSYYKDYYADPQYEFVESEKVKYNESANPHPDKVQRNNWTFIEWQDTNGLPIGTNTFEHVKTDISAYAFLKKNVDLNVYKVVGVSVELISTYTRDPESGARLLSGDSILSSKILDDIGREDFIRFEPENWNPLNVQPYQNYINISAIYKDIITITYYDNIE